MSGDFQAQSIGTPFENNFYKKMASQERPKKASQARISEAKVGH